jgi:two-component system, OmpR family, phosphate regulon sensor histidine kinase PhoR
MVRTIAAFLIAVAGVVVAILAGAPPLAAVLALLTGGGALALVLRGADRESGLSAASAPDETSAVSKESRSLAGIEALLTAIDDPMLLVRERRVVAANAAAHSLLGDHIEGTDVRIAIRHPAAAERLAAGSTEDEAATTRTELVGLGGADRHWTLAATRLPDGSRLVRLTDHSQARAAEQMRADFVANASHELRTPLATVIGFLETLEDEEAAADPATRTRFLKIMSDEATRMRSLVDDLMSLSRIEAERFAAPTDPVDMLNVAESVRESVSALSQARKSEVVVEKEAQGTIVPGDRGQLTQLLSNLVTNALNYGWAGTPVRIRFEEAGGGMLRVRVIDQGEGIAAEHIPRLTERFYRVDASRSRSVGGTGLGLAIAKHIALRHRGRLEIVSKLGEGTSVRVYLPHAAQTDASGGD